MSKVVGITPKTGLPEILNPGLTKEIIKLGGKDLLICYQCGSCTAICPLAEKYKVSFRKSIKFAQVGAESSILSDLTPWLCNLHGDCVESCPRDAKPSTILGAIRNYQITRYDWTGLSKWWFYSSLKSKAVAVFMMVVLSFLALVSFLWPSYSNFISDGRFVLTKSTIYFATALAVISAFFILTNSLRMYRFIGGGEDYKIGFFSAIIRQLKYWIGVESEALKEPEKRYRILEHTLILIGLGILLIVLAVNGIQFYGIYPIKDVLYGINPVFRTLHKLGLYSAALLVTIGAMSPMLKRIMKSEKTHWYYIEFSHSTDWVSLILVFATGLTALITLALYDLIPIMTTSLGGQNAVLLTYSALTLHLSFLVPFMLIEMPFGKHIHWMYRIIANYVATRKGYLGGA